MQAKNAAMMNEYWRIWRPSLPSSTVIDHCLLVSLEVHVSWEFWSAFIVKARSNRMRCVAMRFRAAPHNAMHPVWTSFSWCTRWDSSPVNQAWYCFIMVHDCSHILAFKELADLWTENLNNLLNYHTTQLKKFYVDRFLFQPPARQGSSNN